LALVNVSVTDAHDRPVTFLERDSFRIFEDNIEQEVVNFSSEDVPVSIGVIFDLSGSMAKNLSYAKEAAVQFSRLPIHKMKVFSLDLARMPSYLVVYQQQLKSYRIVSLWPPRAALPPCSMAYIWESVK